MRSSQDLQRLELNGGRATAVGERDWELLLPPLVRGYSDAQIHDYHLGSQRRFQWLPGTKLGLRACFSHERDELRGTAGFGFWNAPYGEPGRRWPTWPQAAWFFFASSPGDLPLAASGPGRGWFASTIDASRQGLLLAPLAPMALLLNQFPLLRRRLWPRIRERLAISFVPLNVAMTQWHSYEVEWGSEAVRFLVDGELLMTTSHSPRGPLGFVCWLDNQYLVARPTGHVRWGTLPFSQPQKLSIRELRWGSAS